MNTNDPKGEAGSRKTPLGLIPAPAMEQTALVHKLGAEKYGAYNWRKTGVCASTYVHAILRHLNAWRDGEDNDPESGLSHIAHIGASCNILLDAAACGRLEDDREKLPRRMTISELVASPEWQAAAEITKKEFGLDRASEPRKSPFPSGPCLGMGESVTELAIDDPTQRIVPIPEEMLPLPDAPEGKKWVGRGDFERHPQRAEKRIVKYWHTGCEEWANTDAFSQNYFHIELIDDDCHICGAEGYKCEHIPGVPF